MLRKTVAWLLFLLALSSSASAAITYRTNGTWGVGKGAALTYAEADTNFWTLDQADDAILADLNSVASGKGVDLVANAPKVFNIKDYGAVVDGSTDDSAAVQAAVTAAQLVGGTVYVDGVAALASSVAITASNVTIAGPGRLKPTGLSTAYALTIGGAGSSINNIRVEVDIGYTAVDAPTYSDAGAGIYITNAERVYITGDLARMGGKGLYINDAQGSVSYVYYTKGFIGFNKGNNIEVTRAVTFVSAIYFANMSLRTHSYDATMKLAHGIYTNCQVNVSNSWLQLGNDDGAATETRAIRLFSNATGDGKIRLSNVTLDSGSSSDVLIRGTWATTLADCVWTTNTSIDGHVIVNGVDYTWTDRSTIESVYSDTLSVDNRDIGFAVGDPSTVHTRGDLSIEISPNRGGILGRVAHASGTPASWSPISSSGRITVPYVFATHGGAVSDIDLGISLPDNAIVYQILVDELSNLTSGGAATLQFYSGASGVGQALTGATAFDAGFTGINKIALSGAVDGIKMTATRNIYLTIAAAPLTAGQLDIIIDWAQGQ